MQNLNKNVPFSEPSTTLMVMPVGWIMLAIYYGSFYLTDRRGFARFDVNRDGDTTISDIFILIKNSWIDATASPAVAIMNAVYDINQSIYRFFELDALLSLTWVIVVLGLIGWGALFWSLCYAEGRIRGEINTMILAREKRKARAALDAVRRGERDKFP